MMPNTRQAEAIRNRITPSCSPVSICSMIRMKFIGGKKRVSVSPRPSLSQPAGPTHLAFFFVRILVVREDSLLDLHAGSGRRPDTVFIR